MEKRGKGKPRRWASGEELIADVQAYLDKCREEERFANIAGFCVFASISRTTLFECKGYYPNAYARVYEMMEDDCLNTNAPINVKMAMLYAKTRLGYVDKLETESNVNAQIALSEEDRALLQRVENRAKQTKKTDKA